MNFKELSESSKERAAEALCAILVSSKDHAEENAKTTGEFVCAAFIAMERFDSAPDVAANTSKVKIGDSGPTNFS